MDNTNDRSNNNPGDARRRSGRRGGVNSSGARRQQRLRDTVKTNPARKSVHDANNREQSRLSYQKKRRLQLLQQGGEENKMGPEPPAEEVLEDEPAGPVLMKKLFRDGTSG
jgi:hypothetical protein